MRRVFMTGASGFVGNHLLDRLLSEGVDVIAAIRNPRRLQTRTGVTPVLFDLERADAMRLEVFSGVDCVFHLAARVHVLRSEADDQGRFHTCNVAATATLARSAARAGVKRFVFVSSIKVNGERTFGKPFCGDEQPQPEDAYSASKLAAEEALLDIAEQTGLEVAIVRPPLIYGPGVGANFARLLNWVKRGVSLPFGAVENRRSLVSVWNLVELLLVLGRHSRAPGRWVVSDPTDVSTAELVRMISTSMGKRPRLWSLPPSMLFTAARLVGRQDDIRRLCGSLQVDSARTRAILSWLPPVSTEEGIARTVAWFSTQEWRG